MFTLCFAFAIASVSFGQLHFGAGVSLLDFDAFGVQGKVMMDLEEQTGQPLDGAATFTYFFQENVTSWAIDLDAHYRLLTIGEDIDFAPIAGLQIARASVNIGTASVGNTDIGINLGGHFNIPISGFNVYAQPKITLGGFDAFTLAAGIMF